MLFVLVEREFENPKPESSSIRAAARSFGRYEGLGGFHREAKLGGAERLSGHTRRNFEVVARRVLGKHLRASPHHNLGSPRKVSTRRFTGHGQDEVVAGFVYENVGAVARPTPAQAGRGIELRFLPSHIESPDDFVKWLDVELFDGNVGKSAGTPRRGGNH